MFHCHYSWPRKVGQRQQRRICILNVIVGEFFTVQLLSRGDAVLRGVRLSIEGRALVAVLPVTQILLVDIGRCVRRWEFILSEVSRNLHVVSGGRAEHLGGEALPQPRIICINASEHGSVVCRINHRPNGGRVLGRSPQSGRSADVNLFNCVRPRHVSAVNGFSKRIEVHTH